MKIKPITEAETEPTLHSLKQTKSLCYEEIKEILKTYTSLISGPLSFIYNHSLHTGFP